LVTMGCLQYKFIFKEFFVQNLYRTFKIIRI
jgi:hypothetical protein